MNKNNRNNEQIYGRNDMIMLDPNNKIYGSLGIADNYVMKTEEGTRLVLNNPKQGSFGDVLTEFNIYGRSEQFSTTGAQLLNENIEIKSRGVTVKINGSTATFDGTVSDEVNLRVNCRKDIKLKPGKYTASSSNEKIMADFSVEKANNEIIYSPHIEIDGTEKEVKIRALFGLKPSAKGDVIHETTNIMLNDGDIALPYEPYTGGIPSPNPDYPQEIKSVVNPIVKVCGKNLLKIRDGAQTTRGVTVTAKDGVVALKGTATETGWAILDIDSFVLDGTCILSANTTGLRVKLVNKSYKVVLAQNESKTLENGEVSRVCFDVEEGKTYDVSNILIQVEKGSETTSYEPYYEEQIATLTYTLNAIPVITGGNYTDADGQQWIADYIDFKRGKLVKMVNSLTLDGGKLKFVADSTNTYWSLPQQSAVKPIGNNILSNYFRIRIFFSNEYYNFIYTIQNYMVGLFETVDELNAFVFKKYRENDPVVLYYGMQEPIETDLTLEQIEQYKKLSIRTPTTIVENNYSTWMKATYKSIESV